MKEKKRPDNFIDMEGVVYGDLTVIEIDEEKTESCGRNKTFWICQCKCGNITSKSGKEIRNNKARKNCGCEKIPQINKRPKKVYTQEEKQLKRCKNIHSKMMNRCHSPSSSDYPAYGASGIHVCDEWHDKGKFIEDMFPSYLEFEQEYGLNKATIDRIDNSKGYSKENCRWLTREQQIQNRDFNIKVTVKGKDYQSIGELASDYPEFNHHTLIYRHNRGWIGDELVLPLKTKIKQHRLQQGHTSQ